MKYLRFILLLGVLFLNCHLDVNALSCDSSTQKTLYNDVRYVKADYEVIDNSITKELEIDGAKTTYIVPNYGFNISIYNVTDNIYVNISNDVDTYSFDVYKGNTQDGLYSFSNDDFGSIYRYTISIRSNVEGCKGEEIKKIKLIKPKFNAYSSYSFCKGSSNYYCQKFTTTELNIKSNEDFLKKIKVNNDVNKENATPNVQKKETLTDIITKHWKLYIVIFIITVLLVTSIIIIVGRKQKNAGLKL